LLFCFISLDAIVILFFLFLISIFLPSVAAPRPLSSGLE